MRLILPTLAALSALVLVAGTAGAQTIGVGASVDCDPVGVGNYRSAIVKEVPPGGREVIVDLDDYTPNGKFVACQLTKLRVVRREAFTKGPPGEYGVYHSGDRVECSTGGAPVPGKIVTLVDPRGVYQVLLDGNDPAEKPVTCETAQLKRFSALPEGGRGFKR